MSSRAGLPLDSRPPGVPFHRPRRHVVLRRDLRIGQVGALAHDIGDEGAQVDFAGWQFNAAAGTGWWVDGGIAHTQKGQEVRILHRSYSFQRS